jgi:hypothetical protein
MRAFSRTSVVILWGALIAIAGACQKSGDALLYVRVTASPTLRAVDKVDVTVTRVADAAPRSAKPLSYPCGDGGVDIGPGGETLTVSLSASVGPVTLTVIARGVGGGELARGVSKSVDLKGGEITDVTVLLGESEPPDGGASDGPVGGGTGASGTGGGDAAAGGNGGGGAGSSGTAGTGGASGASGAAGAAAGSGGGAGAHAGTGGGGAGAAGTAGVSGAAGAAGTAGASGGAGAAGTAGVSGGAGAAGTAGVSGSAGAAGTAGVSGGAGAAGTAGMSGAAGAAGTAGASGTAGAAGTAGASGAGGTCVGGSGGGPMKSLVAIGEQNTQSSENGCMPGTTCGNGHWFHYPELIQSALSAYVVQNDGDGGAVLGCDAATATVAGANSFCKSNQYTKSLATTPDVVIIGPFGEHDQRIVASSTANITAYYNESVFESAYEGLVQRYLQSGVKRIYMMTPIDIPFIAPSLPAGDDIVKDVMLPAALKVAANHQITVIDSYQAISGSAALVTQYYSADGQVNAMAQQKMADLIVAAITADACAGR